MKKAREEKKAAEAAARRERGEPEPSEPAKLNDEEQLEAKLDKIQKENSGKEAGIEINTWEDNLQIANEAKSNSCTVEEVVEEKKIDTREDKESESDEELPPSLEEVTTAELQKERENMTEEQKNNQRVYEGLRSAQKVTEADLQNPVRNAGKEVGSAEEVKVAEKEEDLEEIQDGVNVGSNLEELD